MPTGNQRTAHEQAGAAERIMATVLSWPGVEVGSHRFGGVEFRLDRRELGHLHGDRIEAPRDVDGAIELFLRSYKRALGVRRSPASAVAKRESDA
jgi:hypothetical protein